MRTVAAAKGCGLVGISETAIKATDKSVMSSYGGWCSVPKFFR